MQIVLKFHVLIFYSFREIRRKRVWRVPGPATPMPREGDVSEGLTSLGIIGGWLRASLETSWTYGTEGFKGALNWDSHYSNASRTTDVRKFQSGVSEVLKNVLPCHKNFFFHKERNSVNTRAANHYYPPPLCGLGVEHAHRMYPCGSYKATKMGVPMEARLQAWDYADHLCKLYRDSGPKRCDYSQTQE